LGRKGTRGQWNTYPRTDWAPTQFTKSEILKAYLSNLGADGLTQIQYPQDPLHSPQAGVVERSGNERVIAGKLLAQYAKNFRVQVLGFTELIGALM